MRLTRFLARPTILLLLAGLLAAGSPAPGWAADLPGPDDVDQVVPPSRKATAGPAEGATEAPAPTPAELEAERLSVQGFGDKNPACLAWGDGCITCQAGQDGKPVCANPGPACTPRETACLRSKEPAKEPDKEPAKEPAK
ncbi:MAG: hypothetical protein HXX10_18830 [Rhodoplanes sp.]|uniref:hypothetical protein n=1 Tax=Rhodoplanes sp. TaxID=1968906 RepID=UPI0017EF5E0F|nr:hypothetical protein [Rhodoplanes sp.]NVO16093.1 hypothetical protein [Rhodoplanes sp.]